MSTLEPAAAPLQGRHGRARVVQRRDYTDELFVLWLEPKAPMTFTPGQYVTLGLDGIERPYSLVSAPWQPRLEVFIENVTPGHGGHLTPLLHRLRVGDVVTIRPRAKGLFTLVGHVTHHVMVATVTGIAPYVSMIRQHVHDLPGLAETASARRFYVLHGASYRDEFVYDGELGDLARRHPDWIRYVPSVSRPGEVRNAGWKGAVGRINLLVEEHLAAWGLRPGETAVYLCGHPAMIEDVRLRLAPREWLLVQERFWTP